MEDFSVIKRISNFAGEFGLEFSTDISSVFDFEEGKNYSPENLSTFWFMTMRLLARECPKIQIVFKPKEGVRPRMETFEITLESVGGAENLVITPQEDGQKKHLAPNECGDIKRIRIPSYYKPGEQPIKREYSYFKKIEA